MLSNAKHMVHPLLQIMYVNDGINPMNQLAHYSIADLVDQLVHYLIADLMEQLPII
jgi:hypothetical protein